MLAPTSPLEMALHALRPSWPSWWVWRWLSQWSSRCSKFWESWILPLHTSPAPLIKAFRSVRIRRHQTSPNAFKGRRKAVSNNVIYLFLFLSSIWWFSAPYNLHPITHGANMTETEHHFQLRSWRTRVMQADRLHGFSKKLTSCSLA